jgi:hypothetical protein
MRVLFTTGIIVLTSLLNLAIAQPRRDEGGVNLPKFYKNNIHFGFSIGVNQADFRIHTIPNSQLYTNYTDSIRYPKDTLNLKSVSSVPEVGFNLGIVCDVRLHEYVRLRFLPNLSFGSRQLRYSFAGTDTFVVSQRIESTFINTPLDIKIQSKRLKNFGAYVLGGANYSIDLASNKRAKANDDIVRLKQHDFYYEAGGGADFYLPYFKLALEMKVVVGVKNILIKDGTVFTTPIDKLNSRLFVFSITFEG